MIPLIFQYVYLTDKHFLFNLFHYLIQKIKINSLILSHTSLCSDFPNYLKNVYLVDLNQDAKKYCSFFQYWDLNSGVHSY
jgi:hypothetical protein